MILGTGSPLLPGPQARPQSRADRPARRAQRPHCPSGGHARASAAARPATWSRPAALGRGWAARAAPWSGATGSVGGGAWRGPRPYISGTTAPRRRDQPPNGTTARTAAPTFSATAIGST